MDNCFDIYVAVDGNDNDPGSIEKPYATLERARDRIREMKSDGGRCNVYLRGGTYYLERPFILKPSDSGSESCPVAYRAYPGETPVISGGKRIYGEWMPYENSIMMCKIADENILKLGFTQIYVNGKRQIRARYPNCDNTKPGFTGYIHPAKAELKWPHAEFVYDPETFTKKRWAKSKGAVVHIFDAIGIGNLQWAVAVIDWDTHTIELGKGGFQMNDLTFGEVTTGIDQRSRFYIENVFEELDSAGEWYFDTEEGILYLMPEEGINLNASVIEASVAKQVVELRGTEAEPVHHITFSGLKITQTETTYLDEYEAPSNGDWTIHRGGAIFFEGVEDCCIEDCFFDAVGGNAVFLNNYNRRNKIYGNTFAEAGDSAICLVGNRRTSIGTNHTYSSENLISNNLIHDIGIFGKQTAGVFMSVCMDNTVSHNHIYNLPRAAICINDGTWGGHIIEYNDIHDTVRETTDHGPLNTWGRDRFWCLQQSHGPVSHSAGDVRQDSQKTIIVRYNRFEDYTWWGPVFDDGSTNIHFYNNICIGIGVKAREGDFRLIENNIIINPVDPPGFNVGYEDNNDRFVRNIIVIDNNGRNHDEGIMSWNGLVGFDLLFNSGRSSSKMLRFAGPPVKGSWFKEWDYNLYYNYADGGNFQATVIFRPFEAGTVKDYNFGEWKETGFDTHSIYADPGFVDVKNHNFKLDPHSPAFKLGFKEFDMDCFGLIISNA
jgi:hypothetical protein